MGLAEALAYLDCGGDFVALWLTAPGFIHTHWYCGISLKEHNESREDPDKWFLDKVRLRARAASVEGGAS